MAKGEEFLVRASEELMKRIDDYSRALGVSKAEFIRLQDC